jgi:hypothetical protein
MTTLLELAMDSADGDHVAKIIRDALGVGSDEVANYTFPKHWKENSEQRAHVIGEWLRTEAAFLAADA